MEFWTCFTWFICCRTTSRFLFTFYLWPPRLSIAGRSYMFCDGFIFISTRYLRDRWRQLHQTFREVVCRAGIDRDVFRFSHFCRAGEQGSKKCRKMARFSAVIALDELGRPDNGENWNFKTIVSNYDVYRSRLRRQNVDRPRGCWDRLSHIWSNFDKMRIFGLSRFASATVARRGPPVWQLTVAFECRNRIAPDAGTRAERFPLWGGQLHQPAWASPEAAISICPPGHVIV